MVSDEEIIERILEKFFTKITANPEKWHEENVPVTVDPQPGFQVPPGKIYEVFIFCDPTTIGNVYDTKGRDLLIPSSFPSVSQWFPNRTVILADSTLSTFSFLIHPSPDGLIWSEGMGIRIQNEPCVVMWRDVTKIRGKGY